MYFWITSISVIIGGFFRVIGFMAFIITITFFYFLGKGNSKIDETIKNKKRK